ncbi:MAG: glycerol-3-phosphate acyltransferase [Micavibrio sp.]|nr:glycerol-3-phosphate acyltransferase [Micavibrio sp.]|tara:strand:+ start:1838 stop:2830 length:993 start_codon:yes stop_codon:yes gene_type:complete
MTSISIIGAGAWGTALAQGYAQAGHDCLIWAREAEVVSAINQENENTLYLPGFELNANLKATNNIEDCLTSEILLLVSPAQHLRSTLEGIKNKLPKGAILVICSKGIEIASGQLLSDIAEEIVPDAHIAVLTGPTFAAEIVAGLPCAYTIAVKDPEIGKRCQQALSSAYMRPYLSDDLIGAQIGGAIKNVIAIACGIIHGKHLGESARCALITRGIAETSRLCEALGGKKETLLGMCGIGDLVLTASSMQSRNFSFGAALGEGKKIEDILSSRNAVTEGVHTAKAIAALAQKLKIEMPVCEGVNAIITGEQDLDEAIKSLLTRPLKSEDL